MDIYTVIKNDHQEILRLTRHIIQATEAPEKRRAQLFRELEPLLAFHTEAEERLVYPLIRDREAYREDADRAAADHADIRHLLSELADRPRDTRWLRIFKKLAEKLDQHLRFEEDRLFAELNHAVTKDQAFELGIEYRELGGKHFEKHRHGPRLSL